MPARQQEGNKTGTGFRDIAVPDAAPRSLTIKQLAALTGLHYNRLRRWADNGKLHTVSPGLYAKRLVPMNTVLAFCDRLDIDPDWAALDTEIE